MAQAAGCTGGAKQAGSGGRNNPSGRDVQVLELEVSSSHPSGKGRGYGRGSHSNCHAWKLLFSVFKGFKFLMSFEPPNNLVR